MFESLTQRLSGTVERLRGRGRLTESNISEAVREVRIALLEADVALPVVQALIQRIKVRAVGQEVLKSLTPGQALMQDRARRADRGDGFAGVRAEPQRAGAGGDPDGGPAGRGQDHHGGQAGQAPEGQAQEEGDGGQRRRLSSGRDRAVADAGRPGRRACSSRPDASQKPEAIVTRGHRRRTQVVRRRADRRYRRPPSYRRGDDGRDQGAARRGESGRDPVRGRCDDRPGRGEDRQGISAKRCR